MSKERNASKNVKKAASAEPKKKTSDYQVGKTTVSKIDMPVKSKK